MIGTIDTKEDQLKDGFFSVGTGKEIILIVGSCRSIPYVNYLALWNFQNGQRFTINFIDPFNWNWDVNNERTDYEAELLRVEKNDNLLFMLSNVKIFIHEYYHNHGMFNCDKGADKNIYQFTNPQIDACIPNFNDIFILAADIVSWNEEIKKKAIQDYNVTKKLSEQTLFEIETIRNNNLLKFYDICRKSDFPEMQNEFGLNFKEKRFFWNSNHITKAFTLKILGLLNEKFLKFKMSEAYWKEITSAEDMYMSNFTYLSEYDEGYKWNEPVKPLRKSL